MNYQNIIVDLVKSTATFNQTNTDKFISLLKVQSPNFMFPPYLSMMTD